MSRIVRSLLAATLAAAAPAQSSVVVPPNLASLPGNAALSLPLRWSHGIVQVRINATLLPAALNGQAITGLHLRRPAFLGEPGYGPLLRTLTVRGGFQPELAAVIGTNLSQNRPANLTTLFGPAPVTVGATAGTAPDTIVGADLVHLQFSTPLPVAAGTLFLEFETSDAPLQISADHWVDAVWVEGGLDAGYAVTVGNGDCTTRTEPAELRWNDPDTGPMLGGTAKFVVTGALPTTATETGLVLFWIGLDPQTEPPGPTHLGFGTSLTLIDPALVGCHWWAPMTANWFGFADGNGRIETTFPLAGPGATGLRLGVQAAWLDASRPGLPFSLSNGLALSLNSIGVGAQCSTVFFPAGLTTALWAPYVGQMPVLRLDY